MASSARTPSRWPSGSFAAYDWTAPADTKRPSDDERVERTCRPINEMESARTPGGLRECRGTARYKTGRPPAAVDRMRQPQARDARRDGGRRDPIPNTPQCLPRIELGLRRQMECQVCAGYLSDEQQAVLLAREEELQDRRADVRPRERDDLLPNAAIDALPRSVVGCLDVAMPCGWSADIELCPGAGRAGSGCPFHAKPVQRGNGRAERDYAQLGSDWHGGLDGSLLRRLDFSEAIGCYDDGELQADRRPAHPVSLDHVLLANRRPAWRTDDVVSPLVFHHGGVR